MKRIVIIDDEPLARNLVMEYLTSYPHVKVEAECNNGYEGLKAIQQFKPDLIFLDIQMPKINGFEMLELLEESPSVIFTTAFDEYAIKAFEANAVDYLLKPFSYEEFLRASTKVLQLHEESNNQFQTVTLDDEFIFLKVEYQWVRISLKKIVVNTDISFQKTSIFLIIILYKIS